MSRDPHYPLRFRPIFKEKIWGGRNLGRLLGKELPIGVSIGESWEIAGDSVVADGPLAGCALSELSARYGYALLGSSVVARSGRYFPLLMKFIDAQDRLSVQVHPDDHYARNEEHVAFGKTEAWYVVDAAPGATVIHGTPPGGPAGQELVTLAQAGGLIDHLQRVEVASGDVVFIPAGTVHALGEGVVVCEVQQNCDLTYRLFDWNRLQPDGRPRDLHFEKAAAVSRPGPSEHKIRSVSIDRPFGRQTMLVACRYFVVELFRLSATLPVTADGSSFTALSVLSGEGGIVWEGGRADARLGESLLIPASIEEYALEPAGDWSVLLTRVPDLARHVIQPLRALGVADDDILRLGGDRVTNDLAPLLR